LRVSRILIVAVILISFMMCAALWVIARQGITPDEFAQIYPDEVQFDQYGIPTIRPKDAQDRYLIEGFVVASERLWQMELMRRSTAGRLSEIFGKVAVEHDTKRLALKAEEVIGRAVALLPPNQRRVCERYAEGVNRFIEGYPWRWGIEFMLLSHRPKPWTCQDTLSVLMAMAEDLSGNYERELRQWQWRQRLPESWVQFLYTDEHPWNKPMFGERKLTGPLVPAERDWLPPQDPSQIKVEDHNGLVQPIGSNSWAYRGKIGTFVANDPHLPHRVPQIWYALRVFLDAEQRWVAGVAVPGLPGIIIGMNQDIAWGFTNTGEDIDDLVIEELSPDRGQYRAFAPNVQTSWQPVLVEKAKLYPKGEPPIEIVTKATDIGPIIQETSGDKPTALSRHWLGLNSANLRIPSDEISAATNWQEFNQGVDEFRLPSQNIVYADRQRTIGYRTSGRGIFRSSSSREPRKRNTEIPHQVIDPTERKRMAISSDEDSASSFIATANQRIWIDDISHDWSGDDRASRISEVLGQRNDLSLFDMQQLQHDTHSRFSLILLNWIMQFHEPSSPSLDERFVRWSNWTGKIVDDPDVFLDALFLETRLTNLLLSAVVQALMPGVELPKYQHLNKRAWLISVLSDDAALHAFGFRPSQLARFLVKELNERTSGAAESYPYLNRWKAQHPFVGRVPVLGRLFALDEVPQSGSHHTVKVELPKFGASGRFVWCVTEPTSSVWSFPLGQSGHIRSLHYRDLQKEWIAGKYLEVFPEGHRPPGRSD
jgi:penicillin amidase